MDVEVDVEGLKGVRTVRPSAAGLRCIELCRGANMAPNRKAGAPHTTVVYIMTRRPYGT